MRPRSGLERSPLCLAVPLEGSEAVPGLHALERASPQPRRLFASTRFSTVNGAGDAGEGAGRGAYSVPCTHWRSYVGRGLSSLSLADLSAQPRPWPQFLGLPPASNPGRAATPSKTSGSISPPGALAPYTLPAALPILGSRIVENGVLYAANYVWTALVVAMLAFYLDGAALLLAASLALAARGALGLVREAEAAQRAKQAAEEQAREGGEESAEGPASPSRRLQSEDPTAPGSGGEADADQEALNGAGRGAASAQRQSFSATSPPPPEPFSRAQLEAWGGLALFCVLLNSLGGLAVLVGGFAAAACCVVAHAALRTPPSEIAAPAGPGGSLARRVGVSSARPARILAPSGYSWRQALGREPVPGGAFPWLVLTQAVEAGVGSAWSAVAGAVWRARLAVVHRLRVWQLEGWRRER